MASTEKIEIQIGGMDCTGCVRHVHDALARVPGVRGVDVLLAAGKAIVEVEGKVERSSLQMAVEGEGYSCQVSDCRPDREEPLIGAAGRPVLRLFGLIFGLLLAVVVVGEWMGVFALVTEHVPWYVWLGAVLAGGYPVFKGVIRAALRKRIISHTLMTVGVIAAIVVGEWAAALLVVFFMRISDYTERFTMSRSRRALRDLTSMAPQTARVHRNGATEDIGLDGLRPGDVVVVRPGEKIPADGVVIGGRATINQSAITGESMPIEAGPGDSVFAATIPQLGSLTLRAERIGDASTFGRVIRLVEEAEANRADVQRLADRVATWFLPSVVAVALVTFLLSRDPLATAAVLLVACSCAFAMATPIAMLASIGAAAKQGLLIKGGRYLEALNKADVVLVDKTGTLTEGKPVITDILSLGTVSEEEVLRFAAAAEQYSEHPLAEAVINLASERRITVPPVTQFESIPGRGVRAVIEQRKVTVGSRRMVPVEVEEAYQFESEGKTLLIVAIDGKPVGLLAASDVMRPEVPVAIRSLREMGIATIEILTGDNERTASGIASRVGAGYRADLMPEDKIRIVREYQQADRLVVMIGDGVNDAPALSQADVGIAMGVAGTDVALEAAHIALMREDWTLVPEVFQIAHRTMRVVSGNLGFTVVFNTVGISLAAFGFIPPVVAAAAQSIPDLGILGNSSRLLRRKAGEGAPLVSSGHPSVHHEVERVA